MKFKNRKKTLLQSLASIAGLSSIVAPTTLTTACADDKEDEKKYSLTFDNVNSVRASFIKSYTDQLVRSGIGHPDIVAAVKAATNDLDSIVNRGKNGGFPVSEIYANVISYSNLLKIEPIDWVMYKHYIKQNVETLKKNINASNLPSDQKKLLIQKYEGEINTAVSSIEGTAQSPVDALAKFKNFSKELVIEESGEESSLLATYYLNSFVSERTFFTKNLYWDSFDFNKLSLGEELPTSWFGYFNQTNTTSFTDMQTNITTHDLSSGSINSFFGTPEQPLKYILRVIFDKFDNDKKTLTVHFNLYDHDSKKEYNTSAQTFNIPESFNHLKERLINKITAARFDINATMLDWEPIIDKINELSDQEKQARINAGIPLFSDSGLENFGSYVIINGQPYTQSAEFNNDEFSIQLDVYNVDTTTNYVDCKLSFSLKDTSLYYNSQSRANNQNDDGDNNDVDLNPLLMRVTTSKNFATASEELINSVKDTVLELDSQVKYFSQETQDNYKRLYELNVVYAAEQAAVAIACTILAGVYFAAAAAAMVVGLGGFFIPSAVLSTIGAAACFVGVGLCTVAALEYKRQVDEIKELRKQADYIQQEKAYKAFQNTQQYLTIKNASFGSFISFEVFNFVAQVISDVSAGISVARGFVATLPELADTMKAIASESVLPTEQMKLADLQLTETLKAEGEFFSFRTLRTINIGELGNNTYDLLGSLKFMFTQIQAELSNQKAMISTEVFGSIIGQLGENTKIFSNITFLNSNETRLAFIDFYNWCKRLGNFEEAEKMLGSFAESHELGRVFTLATSENAVERALAAEIHPTMAKILDIFRRNFSTEGKAFIKSLTSGDIAKAVLAPWISQSRRFAQLAAVANTSPSTITCGVSYHGFNANGELVADDIWGTILNFEREADAISYVKSQIFQVIQDLHGYKVSVPGFPEDVIVSQQNLSRVFLRDNAGFGLTRTEITEIGQMCRNADGTYKTAAEIEEGASDFVARVIARVRSTSMPNEGFTFAARPFLESSHNVMTGKVKAADIVTLRRFNYNIQKTVGPEIPIADIKATDEFTETVEAAVRTANETSTTIGKLFNPIKSTINKFRAWVKTKGIAGYKSALIARGIELESLTGLEKAAAISCPALEVPIAIGDILFAIVCTTLQFVWD